MLTEYGGSPCGDLQAEQINLYRAAWADAGWQREPRVSVSRSVIPITTDEDRRYFAARGAESQDQIGYLEGVAGRFGRIYNVEPDVIAEELSRDAAVREADTLL